jgi:hypothetical protein
MGSKRNEMQQKTYTSWRKIRRPSPFSSSDSTRLGSDPLGHAWPDHTHGRAHRCEHIAPTHGILAQVGCAAQRNVTICNDHLAT